MTSKKPRLSANRVANDAALHAPESLANQAAFLQKVAKLCQNHALRIERLQLAEEGCGNE